MSSGGEHDALAPVIPLFGGSVDRPPADDSPLVEQAADRRPVGERAEGETKRAAWHTTWDDDDEVDPYDDGGYDECTSIELEIAEGNLLKKLRTRSLSVAEARTVVAERSLDADQVEAVLAAFLVRKYLDDRALADQLIHAAVERKGQGRRVIAQTLAKRGIPRDVADAALAELPEDDVDRALEFARTKARSMSALEHDAALRRLVGQLSRRGYPGNVAMNAAKAALEEVGVGRSTVRFR